MSINIVKRTSTNNTSYTPSRNIKYIVIHYTAGSTSRAGTAANTASMFSQYGLNASADFIVDDSTIVQFNPDLYNRSCWHCGDGKAGTKGGSYYGKCTNFNSIGIEICSTNPNWSASDWANSTKWSFTDTVVNKAIELTKYLMKEFNIPASNVIRHYDVSGKLCPGIIGWNADSGDESKWKAFKSKIGNTATNTSTKKEVGKGSTEIIYRIRLSANDAKTQKGAYKNLQSAKVLADKYASAGYKVYDSNGKLIYTPTTSTAKTTKYLVEITADVLNVRAGAGTNYKINTTVKKGEVYTIVAEKNGFGQLLSGAGWISLNYTKKR